MEVNAKEKINAERMEIFYNKMNEELCNTVEFYFVDKEITPIKEKVQIIYKKIDVVEGNRRFINLTDVSYNKTPIATAKIYVERIDGKRSLKFEIIPHFEFKGFKSSC